MPYASLGLTIVTAIAAEFPFSEKSILKMEAAAAFHYAMQAASLRWRRFEDQRIAVCFPKLADDNDRQRILDRTHAMLAGPGILVRWIDTVESEVLERIKECERERDETWESFKAAGVLLEVGGGKATGKKRGGV